MRGNGPPPLWRDSDRMTTLALIPARGGSKGLPGKNTRPLLGKPLIAWTIETAKQSGTFDRIVVSTDSSEIADVARRYGALVPFMRPADIAADATPMRDVIRHAVADETAAGFQPELIVLLQPTSPLRSAEDIREAVTILRSSGCDSVVSVSPVPLHLCPDFVFKIEDGSLHHFLPEGAEVRRRQDVRPAWYRNGTVYAFWRRTFERFDDIYGQDCRPLFTRPERSITIDTLEDFEAAEATLASALGVERASH
jgi:CMP-N,N'-diacetyllegionaminic acid synthase